MKDIELRLLLNELKGGQRSVNEVVAVLKSRDHLVKKELIEDVKNLLDEYNEMPDNATQFHLRIPKLYEFLKKVDELKQSYTGGKKDCGK